MKILKSYKGLSVSYKLKVDKTNYLYIVTRKDKKSKETIEFKSEFCGKADDFFRDRVLNLIR